MIPGKMRVIDEQRVCVLDGEWSPTSVIREIVEEGIQEDPFYVMDLGEVVERYRQWTEYMPRVEPFYAVKCNDDKLLVRTLAALGTGFDCASRAEIQLVTDIGVKPERIIFANPAKMASHIRYATAVGVTTMTFDSETELHKIKQYSPDAQLVIRIRCDAAAAQCPLGIKFGCEPLVEAPRLLKLAAVMSLSVVGVSFHVGSGARECAVYARGIQLARGLFELGDSLGLHMRLLDIGGGFAGDSASDLRQVSQVINAALESKFADREVRVIAEPGRYFAAAAYTLAAMIHASREVHAYRHADILISFFFQTTLVLCPPWAVLKDLWPLSEASIQVETRPSGPQSRGASPTPTPTPPHSPTPMHTVFVECALK
ncbi:ornithine decarboxylase 2-like [Zerene cesonia]|uniref:ornithine decarboxylase 2-like n=1 Tax=Zerene cesonia TaxID=33412 RepID=UPI0018E576EE|nr:ornithine decarboxylase 2-like [Zerene cesonia]